MKLLVHFLAGNVENERGLRGLMFGPTVVEGEDFRDAMYNFFIDEVAKVDNDDAFDMSCLVAKQEGIVCGMSSGAATWAALEVAKRPESKGKLIVALLPDTGERYLTTPLFEESRG